MLNRDLYKKGKVPLDRALSKMGLASRTQAAEMIREGRISVNGKVCTDPLLFVTPESDAINIDNKNVERAKTATILFYKPRSVVTTRNDEKGRPTIYTVLPQVYHSLHAAGRLDMATSGLLILTNDTRFSSWLTDPQNGIPRTYVVTVRGKMTDVEVNSLKCGVVDKDERLVADDVLLRKVSNKESHLVVTLTEGKNREIRRLFLAVGHEVTSLKRVSFGLFTLGSLQPGEFRELTRDEILKALPNAPVRD